MTSDATSADGDAPGGGRATLSQVAELASVSVSTVSKVLNGRRGVSHETRSRVESLLHDRRYNRRTSAQSSAPLLEMLLHDLATPFAGDIVDSLERVCRPHGIGLVTTGVEDDHHPARTWIDAVVKRDPLGIILIAAELRAPERQRLRARNIPVASMDPSGPIAIDRPYVGSANWHGGFLATQHLIDLGHSRIGIITGPDGMLASAARLSGYRAALEGAQIPVRGELVRVGRFVRDTGLREGLALLQLASPPTAIFAGSDFQALGVYEAARRLGVTIPHDLSVVGYDDLALASWAGPPLTTVHVPMTEVALHVIRLLEQMRNQPGFKASAIELATSLVARESTAPPCDRRSRQPGPTRSSAAAPPAAASAPGSS